MSAGGLILPDASYYDTSGDLDDATTATNKRNMQLLSDYIKTITQLAGPAPLSTYQSVYLAVYPAIISLRFSLLVCIRDLLLALGELFLPPTS